jgi:hypothetical protein
MKRIVKSPSKNKHQALAVSKGSAAVSPRVTCTTAKVIVANYGFTDIEAKVCAGKVLGFVASRDGKPFAIRIVAGTGELAEVRRLR